MTRIITEAKQLSLIFYKDESNLHSSFEMLYLPSNIGQGSIKEANHCSDTERKEAQKQRKKETSRGKLQQQHVP